MTTWLILAAVVLVTLTAAGVVWWRSRRPAAEARSLMASGEPALYEPLGAPAGAAPDYAMTGDYFPVNYWPVYWPAYGTGEGPAGPAHGKLLGSGLLVAGRGVSGAV